MKVFKLGPSIVSEPRCWPRKLVTGRYLDLLYAFAVHLLQGEMVVLPPFHRRPLGHLGAVVANLLLHSVVRREDPTYEQERQTRCLKYSQHGGLRG